MPDQSENTGQNRVILIEDSIAEIEREIATRMSVYPGWIEKGKITKQTANYRVLCLKKALHILIKTKELRDLSW